MSGVGIDLLDVGRLERALERRPRLAERLFTDGERSYAAGMARPALQSPLQALDFEQVDAHAAHGGGV